jgi:hypothetical protein
MTNQLSVKEALEQGYTHFGYEGMEYQPLNAIEDFSAEDISKTPLLFTKEFTVPSIDVETIKELIGDYLWNQWVDETLDDDAVALHREVKEMPDVLFEPIESAVNEEMAKYHKYYRLTDIKLIP